MINKFFLLVACLWPVQVSFALDLAPVFTDHMVLQRNRTIPVWGKAAPGSVISVILDGNKAIVTTSAAGTWKAEFPARQASAKPITIVISGEGKIITISDVLVGDVWFCSGQSNMGVSVSGAKGAIEEMKHADYPSIRLYTIPPGSSWKPGDPTSWGVTPGNAAWQVCTPQTVAGFTAVGYVFGSELYKKFNIPIGIINAAFGGAFIEPFIPLNDLKNSGRFPLAQAAIQRVEKITDEEQAALEAKFKKWNDDRNAANASTSSIEAGWHQPAFDDTKWKTMSMPGFWQETASLKVDGTLWFRRTVQLNGSEINTDRISIGYIRMSLRIWLNGKELKVAPEAAGLSSVTYAIPPGTLKAGDNIIALRINNIYSLGGVKKINETDFSLQRSGKPIAVVADLSGDWRYKEEMAFQQEPFYLRNGRTDFSIPGVIYNAMIVPLIPFPVTGVVWYQGESNVIRPYEYHDLLQLMIESWRKQWKDPDLPFLIVQLPNYNPRVSEPAESNWASLRAAQDSILNVPNTGIVITYDVGEEKELHPRDKRTVGERLSLLAQQMVYKTAKPEKAFSPHAIAAKRWRKKIVIRFSPAVKLITSDGQAPRYVAVCGPDGKFSWASASIKGNKLYVETNAVENIQRIRYAWADNPDANVFGENGLPVAPFDIEVTD